MEELEKKTRFIRSTEFGKIRFIHFNSQAKQSTVIKSAI